MQSIVPLPRPSRVIVYALAYVSMIPKEMMQNTAHQHHLARNMANMAQRGYKVSKKVAAQFFGRWQANDDCSFTPRAKGAYSRTTMANGKEIESLGRGRGGENERTEKGAKKTNKRNSMTFVRDHKYLAALREEWVVCCFFFCLALLLYAALASAHESAPLFGP